jgi:hypothetical protein
MGNKAEGSGRDPFHVNTLAFEWIKKTTEGLSHSIIIW